MGSACRFAVLPPFIGFIVTIRPGRSSGQPDRSHYSLDYEKNLPPEHRFPKLTSIVPAMTAIDQERDHMPPQGLCQRLDKINAEIQKLAEEHHREPDSVSLVAVSKTKPADMIRSAYACGQRRFGENYAQELAEKATTLMALDIEWHFIGPIQSNKTRLIAAHADWVHSVDRVKIAQRLANQRPERLPPLNICLQVNIDNETSKSGVRLESLAEIATEIAAIEGLSLRGLMCIPQRHEDPVEQRRPFARLRDALDTLRQSGLALDTLSMGMSGDYAAAIAEGATIVRVGTAIFGARKA